MISEKHWHAVYTHPRWEKKVAELLVSRKIETYCPLRKMVKQWVDRKKVILEPLFTSYVFVRGMSTDLPVIRQTHGVLNFLYWLGRPAIVRDDEIENIRLFLNEHQNVRLEKLDVHVNDTVRIMSGALHMREGSVMEVRNHTVKVLLPTMGFAMVAEINKSQVDVLQSSEYVCVGQP